ncbi:MAG: hypothetical protein LKK50_06135 [Prevotella sp.]|jgi:hypothetical protein|nr:hypothetical protein [Prevotella sp.]MCH3984999.1 hypothetical protein [Prevotella sp.]MCI1684864.1 hypothetical protein [Prevotella sp.]MCI1780306.1 hypothetical protein [Prevotella sp.]MCI1803296.1 hypothetical protein [Prevotella sp.]MCI1816888.1 hypothetical protein [Prevotella sp.]
MASQKDLSKRLLLIFYKLYVSTIQEKASAVPGQMLLNFVNDHISTPISERTLQRDIKEILSILPVQISYNNKKGGYRLSAKKTKNTRREVKSQGQEMELSDSQIDKLKEKLVLFKLYDPQKDFSWDIPNQPGSYIFLLRSDSTLPPTSKIPIYSKIEVNGEPFRVLYTGISTKARLRKRIYARHFGNNSGKSTLRKSLGRLFHFNLIPRDKNKPDDGYKKFCKDDERRLTEWMQENLIILYYDHADNYEMLQGQLISYLNPPLNIKDNHNPVNLEFRQELKRLRIGRPLAHHQD